MQPNARRVSIATLFSQLAGNTLRVRLQLKTSQKLLGRYRLLLLVRLDRLHAIGLLQWTYQLCLAQPQLTLP